MGDMEHPTAGGLIPTPLQTELAATARESLAPAAEPSTSEPERSADPALWRRIGTELGWTGIVVDEQHGGLGLTFADLCAVLQEAGRVLLGVPLADTAVCALGLAKFAPDTLSKRILPELAAGERFGTIAFGAGARVEAAGAGLRLAGDVLFVIHGAAADMLLLVAREDDEPHLVLIEGDALAAATRSVMTSADHTRPLGRIRFDGVELPAEAVLARGARAKEAHVLLRAMRAVAQAAEAVGGAERTLEMATGYAKERKQFDRLIGSFQALKHKLADVLSTTEHARTLALFAASCPRSDGEEFARRAAAAKSFCSDAFIDAASENIQVHGGIGFTWEHPAHLFFKRASVEATLVWPTLACREFTRRTLFG